MEQDRIDLSKLGFEISIPTNETVTKRRRNVEDVQHESQDSAEEDDTLDALGREERVARGNDSIACRDHATPFKLQSADMGHQSFVSNLDVGLDDDNDDVKGEEHPGKSQTPATTTVPTRAQLGYDDVSLQAALSPALPIRNRRSSHRRASLSTHRLSFCSVFSGVSATSTFCGSSKACGSQRSSNLSLLSCKVCPLNREGRTSLRQQQPQDPRPRRARRASLSPVPVSRAPKPTVVTRRRRRASLSPLPGSSGIRKSDDVERRYSGDPYQALQDLGASDFLDTRRIGRMPRRVSIEYGDDASGANMPRRVSLEFSIDDCSSAGGSSAADYHHHHHHHHHHPMPRKISLEFDQSFQAGSRTRIQRRGSLDFSLRTSTLPRRSSSCGGTNHHNSPIRGDRTRRRASCSGGYYNTSCSSTEGCSSGHHHSDDCLQALLEEDSLRESSRCEENSSRRRQCHSLPLLEEDTSLKEQQCGMGENSHKTASSSRLSISEILVKKDVKVGRTA